MSGFTYTCPNCSRSGSNSELRCYNCRGQIVIEERNNRKHLTCDNCGLDQLPSCPSCNATITWKKISESGSVIGGIIGIVILLAIFKSCSDGNSSKPAEETYVPPPVNEAPQVNEPPPSPRWTVPDEDQTPAVVPSPPARVSPPPEVSVSTTPAQEQTSSDQQWIVPKED